MKCPKCDEETELQIIAAIRERSDRKGFGLEIGPNHMMQCPECGYQGEARELGLKEVLGFIQVRRSSYDKPTQKGS